jgi:succinate dehydrogenase / fumarate reductase cytochrome b subunit
VQGLILWKQNNSCPAGTLLSRKQNFTKQQLVQSLDGHPRHIAVTVVLIMHLSHFYVGTKVALYGTGDRPHNLYEEMKEVFSQWWIVGLYLVGLVALFWHLVHGFQSAFQTFGINHKKYTPIIIKLIGIGYTVIICLLFALMPVAMFLNWINLNKVVHKLNQ